MIWQYRDAEYIKLLDMKIQRWGQLAEGRVKTLSDGRQPGLHDELMNYTVRVSNRDFIFTPNF
jgi:hypothetical protein